MTGSTLLQSLKNNQEPIAFVLGLTIALGGYTTYEQWQLRDTTYYDDAVHVHSDVLVYIEGEQFDFTEEKYQSSIENILHKNYHFHDNDDNVIHRHAAGLTLPEFFDSLGFTLTDDCLTTDQGQEYCTQSDGVLRLYVDGEIQEDVTNYIPQEEDRILVYYGAPDDPAVDTYLNEISDDACYYSGTCPERGTPPPESCGITCEMDELE